MVDTRPSSVVVTGSHGVGKTTFASDLKGSLSGLVDVEVVPETARLLASRGYQVNDQITSEGVLAYIETYKKNFKDTQADLIISDRSIVDLFVYTENLYRDGERLGGKLGQLVISELKKDIERHDIFLFIPIEFDLDEDGLRPTGTPFQIEIQSRIVRLLKCNHVETSTISGTRSQRVKLANEILSERGLINMRHQ